MIVLRRLGMWFGLPAVLIALWWASTAQGANFFVPKPDKLATTFINVWFSEKLLTDVVPSMGRLLISLVISLVLGVALGIAIGLSRTLRWLLEPLLEFIRAVPSTILIPVLLLLIGINDTMKITVIVLGCLCSTRSKAYGPLTKCSRTQPSSTGSAGSTASATWCCPALRRSSWPASGIVWR